MKGRILTQFSSHANTIADTVRAAFAKTKIGDHTVEMTAPEGSTKGGIEALQHLTLKPPAGLVLVVGTVNAAEMRAEIRSYEHVAKVNQERFKKPLPFDALAYAAFLEKAGSVLGAFGIETKVTDAPRDTAPSFADERELRGDDSAMPAKRRSPAILIAMVGVLLALTSATLWYLLHSR